MQSVYFEIVMMVYFEIVMMLLQATRNLWQGIRGKVAGSHILTFENYII